MVKPRGNRRRRQASAQKEYRDGERARRAPSRDDFARMALHVWISEALAKGRERGLVGWRDRIVEALVEQGFDREAALDRFEVIIDQTEAGWRPRRKPHLVRARGE